MPVYNCTPPPAQMHMSLGRRKVPTSFATYCNAGGLFLVLIGICKAALLNQDSGLCFGLFVAWAAEEKRVGVLSSLISTWTSSLRPPSREADEISVWLLVPVIRDVNSLPQGGCQEQLVAQGKQTA